jgi:hypothetical protein
MIEASGCLELLKTPKNQLNKQNQIVEKILPVQSYTVNLIINYVMHFVTTKSASSANSWAQRQLHLRKI